MYGAVIEEWTQSPKWIEMANPPAPKTDEVRIKVEASGVHRVVRSRASGKHYSSGLLPHRPGIDGVGTTEDGTQVYFFSFGSGTMAEYVNIPKSTVFPLSEGADPIQIAGSINPAMSSWMAFKGRTSNLPENFTCLILGATSASGRIAVPLARALGAKKVIGAARSQETLDALGLDSTVIVQDGVEKTNFSNLDDVDVVIDYIYGPLAIHLFKSLRTPKPVQYVHIGALSGVTDIAVPGDVLRSKDITIRGSGPGAWDMAAFAATLPDLLQAMVGVPKQPTRTARFEDIQNAWNYGGSERLVFVP